jgi:hypothetical protein
MRHDVIQEILDMKKAAGPDSFLTTHFSKKGNCILWASEYDSVTDDGGNAIGRWQLSPAEIEWLKSTGEMTMPKPGYHPAPEVER